MRFFLSFMGLVLLALGVSCQAPKTHGMTTGALLSGSGGMETMLLVDNPKLARHLQVLAHHAHRQADGFIVAQMELLNHDSRDYVCQYRFSWFDDNDMELYPGSRPWEQKILHGGEAVRLQAVSPYPGATRFKVQIRHITR